jgi:two-component system, sensor histidine kinase and response regulator
MRIRSRIFLGYMLLAALVFIVGLAGHRSTHRVGVEFDHAVNRTQPVLGALQEIRFRAVQLHGEVHHVAHPAGARPADPRSVLLALEAATQHYVGLVKRYFPGELGEAEELAEKVAEIRAEVLQLAAVEPSGKTGHAEIEALAPMITELLDEAEKAAERELGEFGEYQAGLEQQIALQKNVVAAVSLAALLVALAAGAHLARRLARPVIALRDAVKALGDGNLQARAPVGDTTEVGELAQAFNRMAEQLAGSMVSRAYVEDIIDSMHEGMLVIDREGRIERVNQGFRTLLGGAPDNSFAGQAASDYFPGLTIFPADAVKRAMEAELKTPSGATLQVNLSVASLHAEKSIAGAVVLVQDISERKRAEGELRELNERLESRVAARTQELTEAKQLAETASAAKSNFLANMSHEIRTPMNSVLGMAHLALRNSPPPKQRTYIENILASGQHLLSLIDDILDISKIEAGRLQLESVNFELAQVIDNVVNVNAAKAAAKGLALRLDIDPALARPLRGDALRLGQVLINLVGNAVKFTERGSVTLRARSACADSGACWIRFEVVDTGIGMTTEEMQHLFQAFQQADASTTRRFGGSGLGLAISKQLVRLMGGEIGVDSVSGNGTTFWFTARFAAGEEHPGAHREAPLAAGEFPAVLKGARILLAEDNLFNQQVACEMLEDAGVIVRTANHGAEALDLLQQETFDCVLMDVQMPEMDGFTATHRIRSDDALKHLCVIAMTANATNEDRRRCFAAGMDDFITKPVLPERLYAVLARHLSGEAGAGRLPALAATPAGDDAAVIDLAVLGRMVNNDPEKIRRFAERFVETARQTLAEIDTALEQLDMAKLGEIGHRTKSSARAVGALSFGDLCQTLESFKRREDAAQARQIAAQMSDLLARISQRVAEHSSASRTTA